MTAYSPDPDRAPIPPLAVVAGTIVLIIVGAAAVFGVSALIVTVLSVVVPAPLPLA